MPHLDRDILLQTLAGYAAVNRITEAERRARLRVLTDAEAQAIFDDLYSSSTLAEQGHSEEWARLDRWRIEAKVELRRAFERLARAQGHL